MSKRNTLKKVCITPLAKRNAFQRNKMRLFVLESESPPSLNISVYLKKQPYFTGCRCKITLEHCFQSKRPSSDAKRRWRMLQDFTPRTRRNLTERWLQTRYQSGSACTLVGSEQRQRADIKPAFLEPAYCIKGCQPRRGSAGWHMDRLLSFLTENT